MKSIKMQDRNVSPSQRENIGIYNTNSLKKSTFTNPITKKLLIY